MRTHTSDFHLLIVDWRAVSSPNSRHFISQFLLNCHLLDRPAYAMNCYDFIATEQAQYLVQVLCRTLAVVLSRYYAWQQA